jgi:hypothetical protein
VSADGKFIEKRRILMIGNFINQRTKAEWQKLLRERWTTVRIFVQEHGEVSALLGFGIGVFVVLFYKLFAFLFCVMMLAYLAIMLRAKE